MRLLNSLTSSMKRKHDTQGTSSVCCVASVNATAVKKCSGQSASVCQTASMAPLMSRTYSPYGIAGTGNQTSPILSAIKSIISPPRNVSRCLRKRQVRCIEHTPQKHIEALISALRLSQINLDSLYSGKRDLTPGSGGTLS